MGWMRGTFLVSLLLYGFSALKNPDLDIAPLPEGSIESGGAFTGSNSKSKAQTDFPDGLNPEQRKAYSILPMYLRKEYIEMIEGMKTRTEDFNVKFYNNYGKKLVLYWDDSKNGVHQGDISDGSTMIIGTYHGHKFFLKDPEFPDQKVRSFSAQESVYLYEIPTREAIEESERKILKEKKIFKDDYLDSTNRPWLNIYPRGPPRWTIWPAEYIGQIHQVGSNVEYTRECEPLEQQYDAYGKKIPCYEDFCPNIYIEVMCTSPPLFVVRSTVVSKIEREVIMQRAATQLVRSVVGDGGMVDHGRTSSTAWLKRSSVPEVDRVIRRIGDMVQIPERYLYLNESSEDLQVVYYQKNQYYNSHYDYGTDEYQNRFMTILLYLNQPSKGGETHWPHAEFGCDTKAHAGAGGASFFYDLLPDGNVNDLTLHAGLPPQAGEKWLCNLWIWDPKFASCTSLGCAVK